MTDTMHTKTTREIALESQLANEISRLDRRMDFLEARWRAWIIDQPASAETQAELIGIKERLNPAYKMRNLYGEALGKVGKPEPDKDIIEMVTLGAQRVACDISDANEGIIKRALVERGWADPVVNQEMKDLLGTARIYLMDHHSKDPLAGYESSKGRRMLLARIDAIFGIEEEEA